MKDKALTLKKGQVIFQTYSNTKATLQEDYKHPEDAIIAQTPQGQKMGSRFLVLLEKEVDERGFEAFKERVAVLVRGRFGKDLDRIIGDGALERRFFDKGLTPTDTATYLALESGLNEMKDPDGDHLASFRADVLDIAQRTRGRSLLKYATEEAIRSCFDQGMEPDEAVLHLLPAKLLYPAEKGSVADMNRRNRIKAMDLSQAGARQEREEA